MEAVQNQSNDNDRLEAVEVEDTDTVKTREAVQDLYTMLNMRMRYAISKTREREIARATEQQQGRRNLIKRISDETPRNRWRF